MARYNRSISMEKARLVSVDMALQKAPDRRKWQAAFDGYG